MNLKKIAELAGVSVATVSKVINGKDQHISHETRERINEIIKSTGYMPNAVARGLKIKKTNTIGLIIPDITNPFFPEIARGIEDVARENGFGVVLRNTDNNPLRESECITFLQSKMVDGIILIRGASSGNITIPKHTPCVIIDVKKGEMIGKEGKVYVDVQEAIFESTNVLISSGCKHIAYISSIYGSTQSYRRALEASDISYKEELIYLEDFLPRTGYTGVVELLRRTKVDGIACGSDLIAIGALNALRDMQIAVPQEIKVIGLDDIYLSMYTNPKLTTIAQPTYKMGEAAAQMIIDHIVDKEPLKVLKLEHKLVWRETV